MPDSTSSAFITVGRVKDAHGLKGELFIVLYSGEAAWLKQLKTLRLKPPPESSGALREFAVKGARMHKNGFVVLSPDIRGRTEAEGLRGYELEVPETFFVSRRGETIYLREVAGFVVFEVSGESRGEAPREIGPIVAFSSNGAQDLAIVRTKAGDFPLPFVEPLIKRIDYEGQRVDMEIPYGLLGEADDEAESKPEPKPESK